MGYFHNSLMTPAISVIIPAHNEEKYLDSTLRSVAMQSFKDFETIVVTNGCTDRTEKILKKHAEVRHVALSEAHVSKARNLGAQHAKGNVLVFLDADTQLSAEVLHEIHNTFTRKHAVATSKVLPDDRRFSYSMLMKLKNFHNRTGLYEGCGGILVCHKDRFNAVGGYDPQIVVKEHRRLTKKLRVHGKYACFKEPVTTSMRRFQNWGVLKAGVFWTAQWVKDKVGTLRSSDYERVR